MRPLSFILSYMAFTVCATAQSVSDFPAELEQTALVQRPRQTIKFEDRNIKMNNAGRWVMASSLGARTTRR